MALLQTKEAAKLLGVSLRQFQRDVRTGLVRQHFTNGKARPKYDSEEVRELAKIKRNGLSYRQVAMMSQRAWLSCRRVEKELQQIKDLLGIDAQLPDLSEEGVEYLHAKALEDLQNPRVKRPDEVQWWSRTFCALGPEYFEAVEKYQSVPHSYITYIKLAGKMLEDMPTHAIRQNGDLLLVYGGLKSARLALIRSAFFYVYSRDGERKALEIFPDVEGSFHQQMLALAP